VPGRSVVFVDGDVVIHADDVKLQATFSLPGQARGVVAFAHGSGSGRHSPRNRYVAGILNAGGFGTVLADLLTEEEERIDLHTSQLRFDIGLLARRVTAVVDWLTTTPEAAALPRGLFGASTGAAAALVAAAERPHEIKAVVSRGGRPDLARDALSRVTAPTLLIVGGRDEAVLRLNRQAYDELQCAKLLQVVPGATHLFEEPGTLERVAELATDWFAGHL
jgi:putative phosphoribosyl transferase